MKNRLLEDIGDSQSGVPVPPVRRVQAAPPPAPQPQADATPSHAPRPGPVPEACLRQRAGVWRGRSPAASPAPPPPPPLRAAPQPTVPPYAAPAPGAEPPRAAARPGPGIASFSSAEPDWSIPVQPEPPPWTERWGRKALGWTIGLAAVVALAGTGAWMVQETKVESTLAVVAGHTPAQAGQPAPPPVPASAPVSEPELETPPPLKLLPPEAVAATPVEAPPAGALGVETPLPSAEPERAGEENGTSTGRAPASIGTAAVAAASAKAAPPPAAKRPAAKREPERRLAAATPAKRIRQETKKTAPKPARERVVDRAPAVPARTVPAQQPDPESPLAETLRLCRAAGYHATACLKRGCEATRFGLVCRG